MPGVLQLATRGRACQLRTLTTRRLLSLCLTCLHRPSHRFRPCRTGDTTPIDCHQSQSTLAIASPVRYRNTHGFLLRHLHPDASRAIGKRCLSIATAEHEENDGVDKALSAADLQAHDCTKAATSEHGSEETAGTSHLDSPRELRGTGGKKPTRNFRKSRFNRPSRPGNIIDWMSGFPQLQFYRLIPPSRLNPSNGLLHLGTSGDVTRTQPVSQPEGNLPVEQNAPVTFYTVVSRHVRSTAMSAEGSSEYELQPRESVLLESQGYSLDHVIRWSASLTSPSSRGALQRLLEPDQRQPFFLLLLYLRRIEIPRRVLATFVAHIELRLQAESLGWEALKILVIRLTRHARKVWPEILPWIASVYTTETVRIYTVNNAKMSGAKSSYITRFSNGFLGLLSLPVTLKPILSSYYQETAQFRVLQFMANTSPPLQVTRRGFRGLARVQLAHAKTLQEREWALLKGPSWPPWMHKRTAMDEGKGYEYGVSRATAIIHRSFEAGYAGGKWEELAMIYAGWNSDSSPTIQTRTTLPTLSSTRESNRKLERLIWAARVRTTRTRAEAWACFLAHETSGAPTGPEVYHAMFERVQHSDARGAHSPFATTSHSSATDVDTMLVAGDMKELIPDPTSPLDMIFVAEPVPTWNELYTRMQQKGVRPSQRLLAFLLDTTPDFHQGHHMLHEAEESFDGGIRQILDASILQASAHQLPDYFLATFIRFLCRFGSFAGPPSATPITPEPEQHGERLQSDQHYLLEYAYSLLVQLRPKYRPAWTAYMHKLVHGSWGPKRAKERQTTAQYRTTYALVATMHEQGIEQDEEQFNLLCAAVHYAAQSGRQGHLVNVKEVESLFSQAPIQLRTLFRSLVNTDAGTGDGPVAPRVPSPSVLHSYVRALGVLGDYEGIYSFTTWATNNFPLISGRASLQHGGPNMLRRTLVAVRVALDGRLEDRQSPAPQELTQLISKQVESVPEWGGWSSDEELERYIRHRQLVGKKGTTVL
ncbi:hypothetical protein K491DRAFT_653633 [Lophiostoma macrostomum CBS 122681]|uniref:Uncharacterized protein n=1 Tax=Lophiostoma macrostomum CBS 122681 TaxID=1314788 RepID=A0A6A6TGU4_9PLEO|nr:hypothetical protein K491DRAFT_653633 [Lophiostoma macrostomum CBS 122681]